MIPENILAVFRQQLATLPSPVTIDLYQSGASSIVVPGRVQEPCRDCPATYDVLEEIAGVSDKLRLRSQDYGVHGPRAEALGVDRIPAIVLSRDGGGPSDGRLRIFGLPVGHFLPLLLEHAPSETDPFTAAVLARPADLAAILAAAPDAATRRDADSRDGSWLPLQYCARSVAGTEQERVATAELLLDHGADPSSALDYACWADNGGVVELLLEHGARLGDDDTVNHLACDGQVAILDVLLRHDAVDMNGTRNTEHHGGYNPLGCAVNMRSLRGVTWFLDHGCDPNHVQSRSGETALHVAVNSGAGVPLVRLLVDRGVNVDQPNAAGHTALDLARAKGKAKLEAFLSRS